MNLDTLERLAKAATPGNREFDTVLLPGFEDGRQSVVVLNVVSDDGTRRGVILRHQAEWKPSKEDQAFITACSPDVILALVARVRALTEALEWLTNLGHDVGKSGGSAELGEIEQALEHAQKILTLTPSEPRNG